MLSAPHAPFYFNFVVGVRTARNSKNTMKKILFSMMALVALVAASCSTDEGKDGNGGNGGNSAPALFEFNVQVDGNSADITVWPANYDMYYYWDIVEKATFDQMGGGEAVAESLLDYMAQQLAAYQQAGYDLGWADVLFNGKDSYSYGGLDQFTDYVVYAFGVDPETGRLNTEVVTTEFTTGEAKDVEVAVTEAYIDHYQGDAEYPYDIWYFEMYDAEDNIIMLALATELDATSCAGTFGVDDETLPTLIPGAMEGSSIYPSFWGQLTSDGMLSKYALLVDGEFTVSTNGNEYTLNTNLLDEAGAAYKASFTGAINVVYHPAETEETASVKGAKRIFRQVAADKKVGFKKIQVRK